MTYNWPDLHPLSRTSDKLSFVCWTRMQAEAGQPLEQIIARKELERKSGDGLFFWGVGNAPAKAIQTLARANIPVPVVFSVMKSRPKKEDSDADEVFAWLGYIDASGAERAVPGHAIVLSRARTPKGAKRSHYALICQSDLPLEIQDGEEFNVTEYRNVGGKEAPVGASQVTALLKHLPLESLASPSPYRVSMRSNLTDGYWVKLTRPVLLPANLRRELAEINDTDIDAWLDLSQRVRHLKHSPDRECQLLL